ncbi:MAG: SGNH/GDSL hydrolase family protein, partial [Thermoanaerobaculia bacterium]
MASRIRQHAALSALGMALAAGAAWAQGGGVNVEKYVAIGDSLTAAFSSGGLSIEQQADSYPALLHRAFQGVGGPTADFEQPLVSVPGLPAQLSLQGLFPTVIAPRSNQSGQPLNLGLQRPYDNLGVPGARMHDVAATVTNESNPLFDLVLRGAGTALQQALIQQPTFVTVQIGNNDVLAAATSGIVIDGVTLTPVASFEADLQSLVGALASSGAQIAIANLPNVTTVPFVTTIPPIVVDERGQPVLVNGEPVPLIGPDGPLGPNDHVLLPASSQALRFGIGIPPFIPGGTGRPLPDNLVLDAVETGMVQSRVAALNEAIAAVAEEHGAVLVDVNALFDGIVNNGLTLGGIDFSADFLTGGLFSYDGVHPTRLGYGVLANAFIEAINQTFDVAVPLVDLERLAFEPPTSAAAADAGVHTTSADNRWTPFVYSREAW